MIENPHTRELFEVLSESEECLTVLSTWTRPGHRAPAHVHPNMEERWTILEGRARFRIGGIEHEVGPGDTVVAPPGVPHVGVNIGDGPVKMRIELRPALRWREFVERMFAGDDARALLVEYRDEVRLPRPDERV